MGQVIYLGSRPLEGGRMALEWGYAPAAHLSVMAEPDQLPQDWQRQLADYVAQLASSYPDRSLSDAAPDI